MSDNDLPPAGEEFWARVRRARRSANMSEAELTQRVRQYGLDFRQETVQNIESGSQPMTLQEALVIGDILEVELPRAAGSMKAHLTVTSFSQNLSRAKQDWLSIVGRLSSVQHETYILLATITNLRAAYMSAVEASGIAGDDELLSKSKDLTELLLTTKQALGLLEVDAFPHWPDWQHPLDPV